MSGLGVLRGGHAEAAPEVAVKVALVGEAGQSGDVGGPFAAFEEPSGEIDPQRNLVSVGRNAGGGCKVPLVAGGHPN
jgi:hypothetical protein